MIIVDAGGCPVTTKVRNIEKAGGQIALIGDAYYDSIEDVYMEDVDGSGFSLTIPALLIGKNDGSVLREAAANSMTVKMKAELEISHADSNIVDVGLWYGNTLDLDPKLLRSMYDYTVLLKDNVKFTPHIITLQCPICVFEVKEKECVSDGLYCLVPPKDEIGASYNVSDEGLLWEAIYGKCLHKEA